MSTYKIAVLAGDGIGTEIMEQAIKVLRAVEQRNTITFDLVPGKFGATAWFETGKSFPDETIKICDEADAILKGTIGLSLEESRQIPVDQQPGIDCPFQTRFEFANHGGHIPAFPTRQKLGLIRSMAK